jgi:hypothetical protein
VWAISFVRGDEREFMAQDQPVYLARFGRDYTTVRAQAVAGEPEVMPALPGAAERARIVALAQRQAPQRRAIGRMLEEADSLRGAMVTMRARNRVKLICREIGKLQAELPLQEVSRLRRPCRRPRRDVSLGYSRS